MPVHQGEGTHSFYHMLCGGAVSCKAWKFIVKRKKKSKLLALLIFGHLSSEKPIIQIEYTN